MTFRYMAYGIAFRSQVELPHLETTTAEPDVDILVEALDTGRRAGANRFRNWEALPGYFQIDIANVARVRVTDGNTIRVDPAPAASRRDLVMHIQGSAFAALLQQRAVLPLHACAVETDRGALLIAGQSGSGKSTTLGALVRRGFRMMADDVTGIVLDDGLPIAQPGFPASRLWQDSVNRLGVDGTQLDPVRDEWAKFYLPVEHFRASPQPVHAILLLDTHDRPDIAISPLPPAQRVSALFEHSFRKNYVAGLGLREFQFKAVTALAGNARVIAVSRPERPFDPFAVADAITGFLDVAPKAE